MNAVEHHPLASLLPVRANQEDLETLIAQSGQAEPIYLYQQMVIEGRVRQQAALALGFYPQYRDWVLLNEGDEPLRWMVRKHAHDHPPQDELEYVRLVVALIEAYREMRGHTHKTIAYDLGWVERRVRWVDWLHKGGHLGPVLSGETTLTELSGKFGLLPAHRHRTLGGAYGKGDKFDDVTAPLDRYLRSWRHKNYEFRHVPPKEAARRLKALAAIQEGLAAIVADLEPRAVKPTMTTPSEKRRSNGAV